MIDRIDLNNFKCFAEASFDVARLNVFAGANGTGKSTVLQALLVLFQSAEAGDIAHGKLRLNGPLINLGTGRDVLYRRADVDQFGIRLADSTGSWSVSANVPPSETQHTVTVDVEPVGRIPSYLSERLLYLSADRLGPQPSYPMSLDLVVGNEVGRRGEFAPLLLNLSRMKDVANQHVLLESPEKKVFVDLASQFDLWMKRLFPGFQVRTDHIDRLDMVMMGLNLQSQVGEPEFLRPSNVGFGVSVVFPIVLAGLLATPRTTLILETPEAHLHPSAQSLIGEFIARVATGGAQVFVETHSDHVINGIRIALTNKVLSASHLRFFAFAKTNEYGSHRAAPVRIDASGEFVSPPDAFFDQADKDLKLIYGLE